MKKLLNNSPPFLLLIFLVWLVNNYFEYYISRPKPTYLIVVFGLGLLSSTIVLIIHFIKKITK